MNPKQKIAVVDDRNRNPTWNELRYKWKKMTRCENDKVRRNWLETTMSEQYTQVKAVLLSVIHEFYSPRKISWTELN